MLDRLQSLITQNKTVRRDAAPILSAHSLACAALLVEAARQDGRFDQSEEETIRALLRARFGLDRAAADALINDAEDAVKRDGEVHSYAYQVRRHTSEAERIEMIEMLWDVAYADGALDAYEDSLIRNVAGLLFVDDVERGKARKRVMARLRQA